MQTIEIREITSVDQPSVAALYRQLYPDTGSSPDMSRFQADYIPLCVEQDHKIIGIALGIIVQFGDNVQAYIEDVVVDESHRGQGLGARLINELLARFDERGVSVVFIATSFATPEEDPRTFYAKFGFKETKTPWLVKVLTY